MDKKSYEVGNTVFTDADFDNCIWFNKWVEIQSNGFVVDMGGYIERHDENNVIINGGIFGKRKWTFVISPINFKY